MTLPNEITKVTRLSKTLAFILFIALPCIAFFAGQQYQKNQEINSSEVITPILITPNKNVIYFDTDHHFQFNVPADWIVYNYGTGTINLRKKADKVPGPSGLFFTYVDNPKNISVKEYLELNKDSYLQASEGIKSSEVNINQHSWTKIENHSVGLVPSGFLYYAISFNHRIYLFDGYSDEKDYMSIIKSIVL